VEAAAKEAKTTKKCNTCKLELPLEYFNKFKKSKDGHQYICRECSRECSKSWRQQRADAEQKREEEHIKRMSQRLDAMNVIYRKCIKTGEVLTDKFAEVNLEWLRSPRASKRN